MLLTSTKIVKLLLVLTVGTAFFFLSGCSSKSYSYGYATKGSHSLSRQSSNVVLPDEDRSHMQVSKQKIRNSKAMHRATMRAYTINGKRYQPSLAHVGDIFKGIASWYGPKFHAKKTSNGEIYDMHAMTAAHKTLPMNTMVRVSNLENGRSAIVRINDRGPFVAGRIIDMSNAGAHAIGMVEQGTVKVQVEVIGFNAKVATTPQEKMQTASAGLYYVQVGAFSQKKGAQITQRKFELIIDEKYSVVIKKGKLRAKPIHRVWVSGFRSQAEAEDFKSNNGLHSAMVIAQ